MATFDLSQRQPIILEDIDSLGLPHFLPQITCAEAERTASIQRSGAVLTLADILLTLFHLADFTLEHRPNCPIHQDPALLNDLRERFREHVNDEDDW